MISYLLVEEDCYFHVDAATFPCVCVIFPEPTFPQISLLNSKENKVDTMKY